jgi:hypothetical protein
VASVAEGAFLRRDAPRPRPPGPVARSG